MKIRKKVGTCAAVLMVAGVLGGTVYGISNNDREDDSQKITLGAENTVKFDDLAADQAEATAANVEIDQVETTDSEEVTLPNVKQVAKDAMPAIVAITNQSKEKIDFFGREYEQDSTSTGSGIIVAKSDTELLIATNNHVVDGAEELTVCFSVDMDDEEDEEDKLVSAQVKGTDSSLDLAVIAVKLDDITSEVADKIGIIQIGDSDKLEVGEWTIAIGNALGYGQSVTCGIVSALDREVTVSTSDGVVKNKMIQTDAAINFGNSGGALLDAQGRLVGINSAKAAVTGVEGMGYAIPINTAKPIIEELMNQTTREKVDEDDAGALGVIPVDVSEEARQIYNIPAGAFIYQLTDDSPSEDAGMKEGDIITKLEKTAISSKSELLDRMQYYSAGETIEVTVKRAGENGYEEKTFEVTLGKKSDLKGYEPKEKETEETEEEDYYSDRNMNDFFIVFGY